MGSYRAARGGLFQVKTNLRERDIFLGEIGCLYIRDDVMRTHDAGGG